MAILTFAAMGLLLMGAVLLIASIVTVGRPLRPVQVPAGLAVQARGMRARARVRVAVSAVAVLTAGVVAAMAAVWTDQGQVMWAMAFLVAGGAGCVAVALMGPPAESAAEVRSAELTPRTARSFGPRWALTAPTLLAAILVIVMVVTAMTATEIDGAPALAWGDETRSGSVSPYPGWSTVLPLLGALAAVAAAFGWALRRVAGWRRPTRRELFDFDDDIRRAVTRMLLVGTAGASIGALAAFGVGVAQTWGIALLNERINQTPAALQPNRWESLWSFLEVSAIACLVVGFALMAGAPAAGRVRRPRVVEGMSIGQAHATGVAFDVPAAADVEAAE